MSTHRVVVIGAGVAGLSAALCLAARGLDVTAVERAPAPGGHHPAQAVHARTKRRTPPNYIYATSPQHRQQDYGSTTRRRP